MKTLVVIGHPDVATSSTQGFFKYAAKQEAGVTWYPLVAPFDRGAERALLWAADRIIFEFPLYWYSVPAVMKAWLDEVFDDDLLGTAGDRLAGKELGLVVNTGRALKDFAPGQGQSFTLAELLRLSGSARSSLLTTAST